MKTIGIIGGMGPLATADLYKKITVNTAADCDQEQIHIVIDSNTAIPDRTRNIIADGADEQAAVDGLVKLVSSGFAE